MATGDVLRSPTASPFERTSRSFRRPQPELSVRVSSTSSATDLANSRRQMEYPVTSGSSYQQFATARSEQETNSRSTRLNVSSSLTTSYSRSNSSGSEDSPSVSGTETRMPDAYITDKFRKDTYDLVLAFLYDRVTRRAHLPFPRSNLREFDEAFSKVFQPEHKQSATEQALISMADVMEQQQVAGRSAFDRLVERLPINAELPDTFARIAREVFFSDQVRDEVFWARLLAVMVFAGRVAVQCVRTEAGNYVWPIAISLTKLIVEQLRAQIERLGSWDAFVAYSGEVDQHAHATSGGSRVRRFLSQLASAATKLGCEFETQTNGPASPQPLVSNNIGWLAASVAIGGVLYSALRSSE